MFGWKMVDSMLRRFNIARILVRVRNLVRSNWILYLVISAYIIAMSTFTIMKNNALMTSGFDLGIFNQAFSTTLFDHKLFYETGDLSFNPGGSFFGVHFAPILFLLLPFYAIYPSVEILLVIQTVILAVGAFPVYWMSRDKLGKEAGLMISALYLVYPPLLLLNLNDFHLEAFASTFFLFSVYYLEKEEWMKSSALIILAMLTTEFAPIIGVFVALYGLLLWSKKKFKDKKAAQKYIALTALVSVLIFVLAFKAKESFNASTSPLPSPFHYILSDPAGMLNVIFDEVTWPAKMFYLINFLAPLASLPVLVPEPLIMALPWIFASFSSTYSLHYSIYFQYTGFVIPFVFVALPKAIERLHLQNARRILYVILLCTIIFMLYLPVGQGSPWNYKLPTTNERTELMQEILPLIPPGASVLTQNDIFPHVSNRLEAYMYLPNSTNVSIDYILIDVASEFYSWQQLDIFGQRVPPSNYTEEVLRNGTFGIVASAKSTLLLKRGYTGEPVLFVPYVSSFNYKNLTLDSGSVIRDPNSTSGFVFYFNSREDDPSKPFWYGPYTDLLPGLYEITYVVKVDDASWSNQSDHLLTLDVAVSSATVFLAKPYLYSVNAPTGGGWFNVTVLLGLPTPTQNVEFRGHAVAGENKSVYLDYLVVEQLSPQPVACTEWAFNPWEGLNVNTTMSSTNVSGDEIKHSSGSGTWWDGPNASLPKGNYTAKFWLRLDKFYDGPLINLDVTSNSGTKLLGGSTVYSSNFTKENEWQSFEVKFALRDDSSDVEFPGVIVREDAPVSFLFVEVYTDTEGLL
jgi:uncharacterized membrane protein